MLGLLAFLPLACVYDPDDRCSDGQVVHGDGVRCVCQAGSAWTELGCVECGANELPAATGGCECEAGFSRATPGAACDLAIPGLGAECDAANPVCPTEFEHCQPAALGGGYCTSSSCATSDDCQGGYACEVSDSTSFCRRPPVGVGKSCESAADCADTEATFCESFQTGTCLVQGCSLELEDCFEGNQCCDLSAFGMPQLCVPEGTCPT